MERPSIYALTDTRVWKRCRLELSDWALKTYGINTPVPFYTLEGCAKRYLCSLRRPGERPVVYDGKLGISEKDFEAIKEIVHRVVDEHVARLRESLELWEDCDPRKRAEVDVPLEELIGITPSEEGT